LVAWLNLTARITQTVTTKLQPVRN